MRSVFKKSLVPASLALTLALTSACGGKKSESHPEQNNLPTGHQSLDANLLAKTVGVLKVENNACTAYISGPNELTTAYHCLESAPAEIFDVNEFTFTLGNGEKLELNAITSLIPKQDRATLRLKNKVESYLENSVRTGTTYSLVAYDLENEKLEVQDNCLFDQDYEAAGVFSYDCETKGHYSGAPLLENGKVIGIHLGFKPKIDRRVAFDFKNLQSERTDVLEVEYLKEGCHMRTSIGVDHTRAHVRGCDPFAMVKEWLTAKKEAGNIEYTNVQQQIQDIKVNTQAQANLLRRAKTSWETFSVCMDNAKAAASKEQGDNCYTTFYSEMNTIIADLRTYIEDESRLDYNVLTAERKKVVDDVHAVSKDLISVWDTYVTCTVNAATATELLEKTRQLKACNMTLKAEFTRISVAIASLDVNPLDTW